MECKCQWAGKGTRGHAELIDTLWNVNRADLKAEDFKDIELIDTLWNVNTVK